MHIWEYRQLLHVQQTKSGCILWEITHFDYEEYIVCFKINTNIDKNCIMNFNRLCTVERTEHGPTLFNTWIIKFTMLWNL